MRKDALLQILRTASVLGFLFLLIPTAHSQVKRDSSAVNSIAAAITKMGTLPPQDSTTLATGTISSGSSSTPIQVKFVTRGMDQTSEQFIGPSATQSQVFSQGNSNDRIANAKPGQDPWSFELSLTAQSPFFPLPWLASHYSNSDIAIENLGTDTQAGVSATHLRLTNTFASQPLLTHYASLARYDVWLDAKSGLPIKIAFERRKEGGAGSGIPIAYEYSDYRNVQGFLYPFHVKKYVNGTLLADITVQSVSMNSGVASSAFQLN